MLGAYALALILGVVMQGLALSRGWMPLLTVSQYSMFPQGSEGSLLMPRLLNRGGMLPFCDEHHSLLVFALSPFCRRALTLTGYAQHYYQPPIDGYSASVAHRRHHWQPLFW